MSVMKKVFLISILLFMLVGNSGAFVHADSEFIQKSERLVAKLWEYYPNVRGTVISVKDDTVFLDVGIQENLIVGAQLAVLQEGIEIIHPKTKEVLGTYERQIGTLQVTEVMDQFSVAKILWAEAENEITKGGKVGEFPGRIKIAVLPVVNFTDKTIHTTLAYDLFVNTLGKEEGFTVFDEADIKAAALKVGLPSETELQGETLLKINRVLFAHNFLRVELYADGENILVQADLLSDAGQLIGNIQEVVREYADLLQVEETPSQKEVQLAQQPSETSQPALPKEPEKTSATEYPQAEATPPQEVPQEQVTPGKFWTSDVFRIKAHKIAIGDLTGDGNNEMILATEHDLYFLAHDMVEGRPIFLPIGNREGYNDELILDLSVADINKNGRAEIFITSIRTISSDVKVLEYNDGKFEQIWKTKGLAMRIISTPAGKTYLVGQKTTSSVSIDFLIGRISEYTWDGAEYSWKRTLDLPNQVNLFGFTFADVDQDGKEDILFYDHFDRVNLYQQGKRRWQSKSSEPYKIHLVRKGEKEEKGRDLRGKIETTRLQSDNAIRLVLIKNLRQFGFVRGLPLYKSSQLYIWRWDLTRFIKELETEEFESYTTDYAIADIDNDGKQEVALAMVLKGSDFFKTPQSQVMIYELE